MVIFSPKRKLSEMPQLPKARGLSPAPDINFNMESSESLHTDPVTLRLVIRQNESEIALKKQLISEYKWLKRQLEEIQERSERQSTRKSFYSY